MTSDNCDEDSEHRSQNKWRNHKPNRLTKAIAAVVIYLLFVFIDAHEIWPFWPLIAVIVGVIAGVATLYLEAFAVEAVSFTVFQIGSVIVVIAGVLIYVFAPQSMSPETEIIGSLKPGAFETPARTCKPPASMASPGFMLIIVGSENFVLGPKVPRYRLRVASCTDLLEIDRFNDGGLAINANIYNENGALMGTMTNNSYDIVLPEGSAMKRPDLNTIGVYDRARKERLWVRYLNKSTVQVRGTFVCHGSLPLVVTDEGSRMGNLIRASNCYFEN